MDIMTIDGKRDDGATCVRPGGTLCAAVCVMPAAAPSGSRAARVPEFIIAPRDRCCTIRYLCSSTAAAQRAIGVHTGGPQLAAALSPRHGRP